MVADGIEQAFIDIDGLQTFYLKGGDGDPVVMIHGGSPGTCSTLNWKHNMGPFAEAGFAAYAFDQPGFGRTAVPADHSMEYRVSHALAFIEALGLKRFHLMGNSMGAYIAARIALAHPDKTGRLVLISSTTLAPKGSPAAQALADKHNTELRGYEPSLENMRQMSAGTFFNSELVTEEFVRERYEMSKGPLYDAMVARQKVAGARSVVGDLDKLTMETLILWGADDRGAALERAVLLFEALPKAELHVFSRCAHWVHWDQAARVNKMVTDFLARPE
jgi:pimeloyl-ACP methyl ester carboxylesterase